MMLRVCVVAALFSLCVVAQEAASDEIQPLLAAGNAGSLRGDYEAARDSYQKAWDLAKVQPNADPARYVIASVP